MGDTKLPLRRITHKTKQIMNRSQVNAILSNNDLQEDHIVKIIITTNSGKEHIIRIVGDPTPQTFTVTEQDILRIYFPKNTNTDYGDKEYSAPYVNLYIDIHEIFSIALLNI